MVGIMNFSSTYFKLQAGSIPCMIKKCGSRTFQTCGGGGGGGGLRDEVWGGLSAHCYIIIIAIHYETVLTMKSAYSV